MWAVNLNARAADIWTTHTKFLVGCMAASAVFFPLGLLMWGVRNRHRVNLLLTVLLLCATAGISLLFFAGVGRLGNVPLGAGDNPFRWYHLIGVANMLALVFLASRGIERKTMSAFQWAFYYAAFGAITLVLFGFPVSLWLGGGPSTHFWLLLGMVALWNGIFWTVTITYPPTEEAA